MSDSKLPYKTCTVSGWENAPKETCQHLGRAGKHLKVLVSQTKDPHYIRHYCACCCENLWMQYVEIEEEEDEESENGDWH